MDKRLLALLPTLALALLFSLPAEAQTGEVNITATVQGYIDVTFNYAEVNFGTLTAGTTNEEAPNQADGSYNCTVDTNTNYGVKAYGTDFSDGAGHTFAISNLKMDTNTTATNLALGDAVALSTSYVTIDTNIPYTETNSFHGFWLSIPSGQYAATYTATLTITYFSV